MKQRKNIQRVLGLLLLLACLLPVLTVPAFAIDPIDLTKEVTMTIHYNYDKMPLPDAQFDIYLVADTSEFAVFTLHGGFSDYPGEINGLNTADLWDALAADLKEYTEDPSHSVTTVATGKTDENGELTFTGLKPGLYLVVPHDLIINKTTYFSSPYMVILPGRDEGSEVWNYSVDTSPKAGLPIIITPNPSYPPVLPKTGILWWPVPVLFAAGVLIVVIGVAVGKRKKT